MPTAPGSAEYGAARPPLPAAVAAEFPETVGRFPRRQVGEWIMYEGVKIDGGRSSERAELWPEAEAKRFVRDTPWCYAVDYDGRGAVLFKERLCGVRPRSEGPAFDGSEVEQDGTLWIHVASALRALLARDAGKDEHVRLACEAAWGSSADPSQCTTRRMAGFGSNLGVYLVSRAAAEGAEERVVVKRVGSDAGAGRLELAGCAAFAAVGAAPPVVGHGDGWFATGYGGETPSRDSYLGVPFMERLGRLAARLHRADTKWFDTHREGMVEARPGLSGLANDSALWPACCYFPPRFLKDVTRDDFLRLHAAWPPCLSPAAGRAVSLHNDLWFTNVVSAGAELLAVDFEGACVGPAVRDLTEESGDSGAQRRAMCRAYLAEAGFPAGEEEVDDLAFDQQVACAMHQSILFPLSNGSRTFDEAVLLAGRVASLCDRTREDRRARCAAIDRGIDVGALPPRA